MGCKRPKQECEVQQVQAQAAVLTAEVQAQAAALTTEVQRIQAQAPPEVKGPRVVTRADRFGASGKKPIPVPAVVQRGPQLHPQAGDNDKWKCAICGFANSNLNTVCGGNGTLGCKIPRDYAASSQGQEQFRSREGLPGQPPGEGPILTTYEQFLEHYGPENVMVHWETWQNAQVQMKQSQKELINQQLHCAVAQVLRADAQALKVSVGEHYLYQCISHFQKCLGSMAVPVPKSTSSDAPGMLHPFLQYVLDFCGGHSLASLQRVSTSWRSWANTPKLWKTLVYSQWPGTASLEGSGHDKGDFKILYRDLYNLEMGRKGGAPKQLPWVPSSMEERDRSNAQYYSAYSMLIQLADAKGSIFSSVVDLRLINLEEQGTLIEGWVQQPASQQAFNRPVSQVIKAFERPIKDFQPELKLSLVAIRGKDAANCKYIPLCDAMPGPEEEQPKEELTFVFGTHVPPALKGFVPAKYNYKCELSELVWSKQADEWNTISPVIRGFKRLRLWCEPDEDTDVAPDEDDMKQRIGYLTSLWDAYWIG